MSAKTKEWVLFICIMLLFIAGMVFLMINNINKWWIWAIYIFVWTIAESAVMKTINLSWWKWALIIVTILSIDIVVISIV